jgi:hypothetical protein
LTTDNHLEFASEELAHQYMPYLAEEGESLTLEGFQQHVRDNIVGLREDGVRHSDDAYALAYFLVMAENGDSIAANWEQVVADATKLQEYEKNCDERWKAIDAQHQKES